MADSGGHQPPSDYRRQHGPCAGGSWEQSNADRLCRWRCPGGGGVDLHRTSREDPHGHSCSSSRRLVAVLTPTTVSTRYSWSCAVHSDRGGCSRLVQKVRSHMPANYRLGTRYCRRLVSAYIGPRSIRTLPFSRSVA